MIDPWTQCRTPHGGPSSTPAKMTGLDRVREELLPWSSRSDRLVPTTVAVGVLVHGVPRALVEVSEEPWFAAFHRALPVAGLGLLLADFTSASSLLVPVGRHLHAVPLVPGRGCRFAH